MLSEMGGTGFPTLMYLDPEGRRIMKHGGPRTISGFEDGLAEAQTFLDLVKKVEEGDEKAATDLLIQQMRLDWFDYDEAKAKYDALAKVSSKQKKELEQLLVDAEVRSLAKAAGKDEDQRRAAGEHFYSMWTDKRIPSTNARLYTFWYFIADYAESARNKKVFQNVVRASKNTIGKDSRYRAFQDALEERLKNFPRK